MRFLVAIAASLAAHAVIALVLAWWLGASGDRELARLDLSSVELSFADFVHVPTASVQPESVDSPEKSCVNHSLHSSGESSAKRGESDRNATNGAIKRYGIMNGPFF